MKTALLVIDVQQSFFHRPFFTKRDLHGYLEAQNALIKGAIERKIPTIRIFHASGEQTLENPFSQISGHVRAMDGLREFSVDATFIKSRHSALVDTGLQVWLTQNGIQRLIVSGIRTEQCCETTARHASDLGFEVDFVLDATLTFDMIELDEKRLSAEQIKMRTASILQNHHFATICNVDEALKRAI